MLRRVRDFAQLYYQGVITKQAADHALSRLEVDKLGLDATDRRMLASIIKNYGGGPVGLRPWRQQLARKPLRWRTSMSHI